ncbi:putative methyltransferase TARBP1 [Papilio xuthus]|uniref:tRNA (guanosine(18)-2'-O)-methyltransferase TARBP1 n=1 Tax=Papilio xuthus TaxID=66420 RepID=A0A194PIT7_PAPXU|nr:putative methyltransferase TARBP1 [Papilio xuthus]
MLPRDDLISFMDLLDLDEEVVDTRLAAIMERSNFIENHLSNALHLLKYKQLINLREDSECDNDKEFCFVSKLLSNLQEDNVEIICKIIKVVLSLNPNTLVSKSEHLVQQILCNLELPSQPVKPLMSDNEDQVTKIMLDLKVCSSIVEAVINNNDVLTLPFLEVPLENVLYSNEDKLKGYFLTKTVPLFFKGVHGYGILDRIWKHLIQLNNKTDIGLKTLSCLSDYYLPSADGKITLESEIIFKQQFWEIILDGLMSDLTNRKMSMYLAKRALDYLRFLKKDAMIKSEDNIIFKWTYKNMDEQKVMWNNFFIVLDSLEEKQSNIVLPSLRLLETLKDMPEYWLNCIFNLGLKHDNTQVRLKCIENRLKFKIHVKSEAKTLLDALNDTYLFDKNTDYNKLKNILSNVFSDIKTLMCILSTMPEIKWAPVPLFHISEVLASVRKDLLSKYDQSSITQTILNILKISCNNILIRKAILVNISHLVGNCCKGLHWKEYLNLYSHFQFDSYIEESRNSNPFLMYLKENTLLQAEDIQSLFILITTVERNIDFGLFYIQTHPVEVTGLLTLINKMILNIQDINQRQFADKMKCFDDVVSLTNIFSKTIRKNNSAIENINLITATAYKTILEYLISLLGSDKYLCVQEIDLLFVGLKPMIGNLSDYNSIQTVLQVFKSCILLLLDNNVVLEVKIFSVHILSALLTSPLMIEYYGHIILSIEDFLKLTKTGFVESSTKERSGRLKNVLYEKYCEILYNIIKINKNKNLKTVPKEFTSFIDNAVECGGYGCLIWILKIMKEVIPILDHEFDLSLFLEKMWKEIEELKTNNQYIKCIEEFVNIITENSLLNKPEYNNLFLSYWHKIIEYGPIKNTPLFFLIREINGKDLSMFSQMVYALCDILLYCPIPRKDQRITDNLSIEILNQNKYGIDNRSYDVHFNFHIQYLSYSALSKADNQEVLNTIIRFIINKINMIFTSKKRYHGNSISHRTLLTAMQTLLLILLKSRDSQMDNTADWCMDILGSIPHQPSVRICLEWYIALYYCFKKGKKGELIVVASLIDKLPNLGGLARTSEVFGIKTYVIDSLRHLQDKQFQGLSVSAERWIDVEEVRPCGLKQYLMEKKSEGYSVVAAEQTSTSSQLQKFKFPKKTLLLLGHEKEGVPCDLLPLMDFCVEIPQQGVVRSLNVHVTAAIFVWEYSRQIML